MPFSVAMIGAGQFAGSFAHLFHLHPGVTKVYATDVIAERADDLVARHDLAGTFASFDEVLASPEIDAVAIFTQRWSHGPLVVQALRAGKHVYSAVPMAITTEEIAAIKTLYDAGLPQIDIAIQVGRLQSTVNSLIRRCGWTRPPLRRG